MSWIPHKGAQEEFLSRPEFEVLFGGAAGPGKTDCLVAGLTRDIEHPKYHGLILRRTFPQLQEVIDRCLQLYGQMAGIYRTTDKRWTFPSGAIIDLGHMQHENDKYNYQGKEFTKVAFDELTQFSETQYTYLHSRVSTTSPDLVPQVLASTNPGGLGHNWVKERFQPGERDLATFFDPKTGLTRVFVPAKIEDNPTLFDNDPAYLQRLDGLPEIENKRLRHGIWDAFEGQVFTELSQLVHGYEDFDIPPEWERYCVFDWGFSKPFSVGWYAVDYDGCIWRYREWYGSKREHEGQADGGNVGLRMQAWEVARGILDREKGEKIKQRIADPSIWHPRPEFRKKESRGLTIHDDFSAEGVYFFKADNDRMHGKMQVHKRLKVEVDIDMETGEVLSESPMLKVANSCKGFWRTFPELHASAKNTDDVDTDQEEHIYDEVRYMCMSRPLRPKTIERIPSGSFQAERSRLIRAKQYATRHGTSISAAYTRIK